jgi:hypothetical protein
MLSLNLTLVVFTILQSVNDVIFPEMGRDNLCIRSQVQPHSFTLQSAKGRSRTDISLKQSVNPFNVQTESFH